MMTTVADAQVLFAQYRDRVYRYMYRASGQAEVARDLTQDVFLRVSRANVPVAADGQIAAWLFRIARNIVVDHQRQRQRHRETATVPEAVLARAASQETVTAVNQALAALPELDRDVFLMRELAGLGYDEIAVACDLTPAAVRSRIHRARVALRELLSATVAERRGRRLQLSCEPGHRHD
jgi:RNA polymerase sigma-70 factor (ECF subfamily)